MTDRVFISYSSKHPIYAQLVAWHLKQRGLTPWWDRKDLEPGEDWERSLFQAIIKDCFALVVVLTREAIDSPVVKDEVSTAIAENKVVIALIIEANLETALSAPLEQILERFCPGLSKKQSVRFDLDGYEVSIERLMDKLVAEADTWGKLQSVVSRLSHFSPIARANALHVMANIKDPRAMDSIITAHYFETDYQFLLNHYVPALESFGANIYTTKIFIDLLKKTPELMEMPYAGRLGQALGLCGKNRTQAHIDLFVDVFANYPPAEQTKILRKLLTPNNKELNDFVFLILKTLLELEDDERQISAIYAFGTSRDKSAAIQYLKPLLESKNMNLRKHAIKVLKKLKYDGELPLDS